MPSFYYQNPLAPPPSSLHIGTAVAIFREQRVLMDWRSDGDFWALVGGAMELGESIEDCVRREVSEETGFELSNLRLLGLFSHPSRIIVSNTGKSVQSVSIVFAGECPTGELRLSEESRGMRFFTAAELEALTIVPTHQMIVPYLFRPELWPVLA